MAEIFGAVASGAGLISLSMQLLESSQKLKGFYDSSRDAPETVRQLCFDLETMSMALRQFEQYRQHDILGSGLLTRCIVACDQAVNKIKAAVDKVDRLLSKARFAGRIYMGFKEPEVKRLLEEMEHAKSSMLLAYTSYCQSWNMRESGRHAAALSLQTRHLERLQASVESGNVALIGHLTAFAPQQVTPNEASLYQLSSNPNTKAGKAVHNQLKRGRSHKYRLPLPRWLVGCVWELGVHECDNVWTFQVTPINLRPSHTYVFDFVRAGDVGAVRKLVGSGQLSIHDREPAWDGSHTLLEMAAEGGHFELCKFLLQETSHSDDDAILRAALIGALGYATDGLRGIGHMHRDRPLFEAFYGLIVGASGLEVELRDIAMTSAHHRTEAPLFLTNTAFQIIMSSQPAPFTSLPFAQRFATAMDSFGWPAEAFSTLMDQGDPVQFATQANEDSRTALHWAAAHFGEWSRRSEQESRFPNTGFDPSGRVKGYGELASRLVSIGADVHALCYYPYEGFPWAWTSLKIDPFLTFLAGVKTDTTWYWTLEAIHHAVRQWGQMLVSGGHHLLNYISAENKFLQSVKWDQMDSQCLLGSTGCMFVPVKLSLSDDLTLAVEIKDILSVPMWKAEAQNIPGAWPNPSSFCSIITWSPGDLDMEHGIRWIDTGSVSIESKPYPVRVLEASNHTYDLDNTLGITLGTFHDDCMRHQDDHDRVARIVTRARQPSESRLCRRRASSCPPLMKRIGESWGAQIHRLNTNVKSPSGWQYMAHQCPVDSQWHIRATDVQRDEPYLWRQCVRGLCHESSELVLPEQESSFEGWFLRNEKYVHVAKGFAERFFPQQISIVEATLERATERARLAMGPKRREDTS